MAPATRCGDHRPMSEPRAIGPCPICDGCPTVLVAISHPLMRMLTLQVLGQEHGCWSALPCEADLSDTLERLAPDLAVVDAAAFPRCCEGRDRCYPRRRVIVVGPEPDPAYRAAALRRGAGGWVARDHIAEDLSSTMRATLGCHHGPCPDRSSGRVGGAPQSGSVGGPDDRGAAQADHRAIERGPSWQTSCSPTGRRSSPSS
jgi:hypothetical protein